MTRLMFFLALFFCLSPAWAQPGTNTSGNFGIVEVGGAAYIDDNGVVTGDIDVVNFAICGSTTTNTCIDFVTDDQVVIETNGFQAVKIDSGQRMTLGDTALIAPQAAVDDLVVDNGAFGGISILAATEGAIAFGDGSDADAGKFGYNHSNFFVWKVSGADYAFMGDQGVGSRGLRGASTANPAILFGKTPSATVPTLITGMRGSDTTGIGGITDTLSLIILASQKFMVDAAGVDTAIYEQLSVGATCGVGQWQIDTDVTVELCYCASTDTWTCWSADTVGGPSD